jgi:hypothetical protein
MNHDKSVCTNDNRRAYLCSVGWRFWGGPDNSFTKNGLDGRFSVNAAFEKETAGLTICPVCNKGAQ